MGGGWLGGWAWGWVGEWMVILHSFFVYTKELHKEIEDITYKPTRILRLRGQSDGLQPTSSRTRGDGIPGVSVENWAFPLWETPFLHLKTPKKTKCKVDCYVA